MVRSNKHQPNPASVEAEDIPPIDPSSYKPIGRGLRKDAKLPLRALRESVGETQAVVAERAGMPQGDVSRLESQGDTKLSTLVRYVAALGGHLEIVAVFSNRDGRRIHLELPNDNAPSTRKKLPRGPKP